MRSLFQILRSFRPLSLHPSLETSLPHFQGSALFAEQLLEPNQPVHHCPVSLRVLVHVVPNEGAVLIEAAQEEPVVIVLVELVQGDHRVARVEQARRYRSAAKTLARLLRLEKIQFLRALM